MKTVCLVYILFYIMLMFYDDKPCKPKHCIQDILSSSRALGLAFSPSARQGILIQLNFMRLTVSIVITVLGFV